MFFSFRLVSPRNEIMRVEMFVRTRSNFSIVGKSYSSKRCPSVSCSCQSSSRCCRTVVNSAWLCRCSLRSCTNLTQSGLEADRLQRRIRSSLSQSLAGNSKHDAFFCRSLWFILLDLYDPGLKMLHLGSKLKLSLQTLTHSSTLHTEIKETLLVSAPVRFKVAAQLSKR